MTELLTEQHTHARTHTTHNTHTHTHTAAAARGLEFVAIMFMMTPYGQMESMFPGTSHEVPMARTG